MISLVWDAGFNRANHGRPFDLAKWNEHVRPIRNFNVRSNTMSFPNHRSFSAVLVMLAGYFTACGSAAVSTMEQQETVEALTPVGGLPSKSGKQYVPVLGIYLPVLAGQKMQVGGTEVRYMNPDGTLAYSVNWEAEPEELFQRFVNGIPVGNMMVRSNGQIEDWGKNRTAFATFFGDPNTGEVEEYRMNVWEAGHDRGMFCCTAYFTEANETVIAALKNKVMALMDGVEHLSAQEVAEANAHAREAEEGAMAKRREAIGSRSRDGEEARLRQELTGLALVKLKTTASSSSSGGSSLTTLERFQLCPSGQGIWTYGTDMVIQAERTNNVGDISDVGSATSTTDNQAIGTWDVERYEGRLLLVIYTYDGQEKSWNIAPGADAWSYLIGGKVFQVSKAGGLYGPECR